MSEIGDNNTPVTFKYNPNIQTIGVLKNGDGVCQSCGEKVKQYYPTMYSREKVDCICLKCIKNGQAADRFQGQFIQDAEIDAVSDEIKIDELFNRTPGYTSWQGEHWLACCDDFCAYIGEVGTKELVEMGIDDDVFAEYDALDEYENARDYLVKAGSMCGYLFQCLHCGRYHLWVDAD